VVASQTGTSARPGSPSRAAFALGLLLLVLLISLAIAVGTVQLDRVRQELATQALGTIATLQAHIEDERLREIEAVSSGLAADPSFVSYIAQAINVDATSGQIVDVASIRELLDHHLRKSHLQGAAILDTNGKSVATFGEAYLPIQNFAPLAAVVHAPGSSGPASGIIDDGNRLHLVTITPLERNSEIVALLLAADMLDDEALRAVAKMGRADLALMAFPERNPHLLASTLDAAVAEELLATATRNQAEWLAHAARPDSVLVELVLGGKAWTAQVTRMHRGDKTEVLVALLPPDRRSAAFSAIALPLTVGTALAIVALIAILVLHWRRILGPIAAIAELAERAGRGDYALSFKASGSGIAARLATALNQIVGQLDRFRVPPGTPRRRTTDRK